MSKSPDFWFYSTTAANGFLRALTTAEKKTLLEAATHYNAVKLIKHIGGSKEEIMNAADVTIKEKKAGAFNAFIVNDRG